MDKICEKADSFEESCKNCPHFGNEHIIPDHNAQSRTKITDKFGKCTKCEC